MFQKTLQIYYKRTSDHFVLMCVSNCQIECNKIPTSGTRKKMPVYQFSQAEQTVDQFFAKTIIEEVISPIQFLCDQKRTLANIA